MSNRRGCRTTCYLGWLGAFEIYFLTVEDKMKRHSIRNYVEDILGLPFVPRRVRLTLAARWSVRPGREDPRACGRQALDAADGAGLGVRRPSRDRCAGRLPQVRRQGRHTNAGDAQVAGVACRRRF